MLKKSVTKNTAKPMNPNKILVENFVSLQKVMTNLSLKFDNLAGQISKLLQLFEISAKALAEKEFNAEKGDKTSKKILEKIDNLLEQNKIIARGLTLIHEKEEIPMQPAQRFPAQFPRQNSHEEDMNGFQKSISSNKR